MVGWGIGELKVGVVWLMVERIGTEAEWDIGKKPDIVEVE